jgi:hypothetical protein
LVGRWVVGGGSGGWARCAHQLRASSPPPPPRTRAIIRRRRVYSKPHAPLGSHLRGDERPHVVEVGKTRQDVAICACNWQCGRWLNCHHAFCAVSLCRVRCVAAHCRLCCCRSQAQRRLPSLLRQRRPRVLQRLALCRRCRPLLLLLQPLLLFLRMLEVVCAAQLKLTESNAACTLATLTRSKNNRCDVQRYFIIDIYKEPINT